MMALKVDQWTKFCESIKDTPKFPGDYWKKIKQISTQSIDPPKYKSIPKLFYENEPAYTDSSKADVFTKEFDAEFLESDIKLEISKLKPKSSPGTDGIRNSHIINLPENGIKLLLLIANLSWKNSEVFGRMEVGTDHHDRKKFQGKKKSIKQQTHKSYKNCH